MKIRALPILEGENAPAFEVDVNDFLDLTASPNALATKIPKLLCSHKALVLQATGDTPWNVEDFGQLVSDCQFEFYPYIGGAAPRTIIPVKAGTDIVFTANESPPDQPIPFHHELAQTPNPPNYIFFFCDTPPTCGGGQTPLIDSTKVYRYTKENFPELMRDLCEHGVRYRRVLPAEDDPSSPIGRSWKNTWNVKSAEELNDRLAQIKGCEWQWVDDDCVCITTQAVPALRLVESSEGTDHEFLFQNTFQNSVVAAFLGWQDSRNDRLKALLLGNNEPLPNDALESIADFMHENRVLYSWKKGDIMAIDNSLVMHSRNPFKSSRRVLASLWGAPKKEENKTALRTTRWYQPLPKLPGPADPLVFGFWKVPREICSEVCYQAIKAGYRRLDCACDYGNEVEVGQGVARAFKEGLVKRTDLFITSKLWNTFHATVRPAMERTLADLQLEYVDEYLIHFPISLEYVPFEERYPPEWTNGAGKMAPIPHDITQTWHDMEDLVHAGMARQIGVCNFGTALLRQLLVTYKSIRPATCQVELHPHNSQDKLIRFCHDAGIHVIAFSVLGSSSYVELGMATSEDSLLAHPVVQTLAAQHAKSPAQILLRWALQRSTLPLCKTSQPERMHENRNVFDFFLSPADVSALNALDSGKRYNDPGVFAELAFGCFFPIYD